MFGFLKKKKGVDGLHGSRGVPMGKKNCLYERNCTIVMVWHECRR